MIINPGEGKSPYQYAVDGGYTGTEEEFRAALASGPWLPMSIEKQVSPVDKFSCVITPGVPYTPPNTSGALSGSKYGIGFSAPIIAEIIASDKPIHNVGAPVGETDAATRGYVDQSISAVAKSINDIGKIETVIFSIDGPVSANEEVNVTLPETPDDPFYNKTIIYFGPKIGCPYQAEAYSFDIADSTAMTNVNQVGGEFIFSYTLTLTLKANKAIASDTSVEMLLAWV